MTTIEAVIIKDSICPKGIRLTTMELTYPRYIHSEFMTHRVFSRNSASSRAIPVAKQLRGIAQEPVTPRVWGKNIKGMQSSGVLEGWRLALAKSLWAYHRWSSIKTAQILGDLGLHKQWANRLVEPHSHIRVIVSSTKWANFYELRDHMDAMPEIRELAIMMRQAHQYSVPTPLKETEWHLPYVLKTDLLDLSELYGDEYMEKAKLLSMARCARVSYTIIGDGGHTVAEDLRLGERLTKQIPLHASPMEHQATPDPRNQRIDKWGNFHGWVQLRKLYHHESVADIPLVDRSWESTDPASTDSNFNFNFT
jgi:hypothetical protein